MLKRDMRSDDDSDDFVVIGATRKRDRSVASESDDHNAQPPQKIFPVGTRFMNLVQNTVHEMDIPGQGGGATLENVTSMYDSYYLNVLRERFNVTTRMDGNVYAYVEFDAEEQTSGSDDVVFLVPPTRVLYRSIRPPPPTNNIQDRVRPEMYQFVRMVAGATTESIKYLVVTSKNETMENPTLRQQHADPLENGSDDDIEDVQGGGEQQGFFDAADLDFGEGGVGVAEAPAGASNAVHSHSKKDQRRVVRDALKYSSLIHSEDDAGNQRMYRPLKSTPPQQDNQWEHDRFESTFDIPEITMFAVKAKRFDNPNLFASNFVYTMSVASSLVQTNAPGYSNEMWVKETETPETFNLGTLLDKSEAFDESLRWFQNIVRSFLLRYVLEFRQSHPNSGWTPVRFWMYHASETDVGMVALSLLGLVQVPELRSVDKKRVGALTNILCAVLTNGTKRIVKEFEESSTNVPLLIGDHRFMAKFAHLTALLMARAEGNFTKNGSGYVPNGELPRLQREISYILRWFSSNQIDSSYRKSVPLWLRSF
jgi:hypothetical protein